MKKIKIWIIITISCVMSPYLAHKVHATCLTQNNKHPHKHVVNCTYSQKDLNRILATNKDRYCTHCENKTCFYCGCPIIEHSKE